MPESFINSTGTLGFRQHPTVLDWGIIWGGGVTSFGGMPLVPTPLAGATRLVSGIGSRIGSRRTTKAVPDSWRTRWARAAAASSEGPVPPALARAMGYRHAAPDAPDRSRARATRADVRRGRDPGTRRLARRTNFRRRRRWGPKGCRGGHARRRVRSVRWPRRRHAKDR